ncbi:hypothetical protein E2C01_041181 [Portunus trituberculatus]|uniref:Uncharacterized protein n=1 Tax=Portunus trituberculatus TaxID=210409 RepID=A0A5B7FSU5_PORTR|nr:hypothetical protein [Portunus trituberculatus]
MEPHGDTDSLVPSVDRTLFAMCEPHEGKDESSVVVNDLRMLPFIGVFIPPTRDEKIARNPEGWSWWCPQDCESTMHNSLNPVPLLVTKSAAANSQILWPYIPV